MFDEWKLSKDYISTAHIIKRRHNTWGRHSANWRNLNLELRTEVMNVCHSEHVVQSWINYNVSENEIANDSDSIAIMLNMNINHVKPLVKSSSIHLHSCYFLASSWHLTRFCLFSVTSALKINWFIKHSRRFSTFSSARRLLDKRKALLGTPHRSLCLHYVQFWLQVSSDPFRSLFHFSTIKNFEWAWMNIHENAGSLVFKTFNLFEFSHDSTSYEHCE